MSSQKDNRQANLTRGIRVEIVSGKEIPWVSGVAGRG